MIFKKTLKDGLGKKKFIIIRKQLVFLGFNKILIFN